MNIQPDDSTAKRSALASTRADLRELRGNSQATVRELQEFLRQLKGRSPQEMLGVVASSQLARSLVQATVIVAAAILVFTAIPYFFGNKEQAAATPPVKAPAPETPAAPAPPEAKPAQETDPLSVLGVGGNLPAPANENPLENSDDDFLKDLE